MAFLDRFKTLFASSKLDVKARFDLLREGISGSMSKFYMARDRDSGEVVGLKILDLEKTKHFEDRFPGLAKPCEGEIAIQFDHPYIVKTREFGKTTKGQQYLVMEYLEGAGMNWILMSKSPVLEGQRTKFIRQTAEALAVVHEADLIHRDICPRNLLFTGDNEVLKLTDFGLSVPATKPFMQPGNRTGTADYMAPELIRRHATDKRVDIFAFGMTAYEICTGQLPWPRRSSAMSGTLPNKPPADISGYRPKIHPRLAKAIHACLEPDVPKRCPSMEEFLGMLRLVDQDDVE